MARAAAAKKPRALVTGGAGFIASDLCERLISEGYSVVCVDNLKTGSLENIAHMDGSPGFEFVDHDVTAHINVPEEFGEIYHFASPASPIAFERIPILKVGALGTHNALRLARMKRARFMLASTSEVYGDPLVHPQHEECWGNVNSVGIRGVYDEAKRYAEAMTMAYHRHHSVDTRIVRVFNTYGPRMRADDGRMIPTFVTQALSGEPLTIHGDGSQTRSIQYVDDLTEGVIRLMKSSEVRRVNELVVRLAGSESPLAYMPLPEDDPKQRCPDISRAREVLDWEPRVPAEEGLQLTLKWFAARRGVPSGQVGNRRATPAARR